MARPKAQPPTQVSWPDLGAGQAERLRLTRADKGWSLRYLAAASGVSVRTIRAIEAGGKGASRSDVLAAFADALRVSRGWLSYGG
jgi:transcriptional regulator with XRE-family HTH domain